MWLVSNRYCTSVLCVCLWVVGCIAVCTCICVRNVFGKGDLGEGEHAAMRFAQSMKNLGCWCENISQKTPVNPCLLITLPCSRSSPVSFPYGRVSVLREGYTFGSSTHWAQLCHVCIRFFNITRSMSYTFAGVGNSGECITRVRRIRQNSHGCFSGTIQSWRTLRSLICARFIGCVSYSWDLRRRSPWNYFLILEHSGNWKFSGERCVYSLRRILRIHFQNFMWTSDYLYVVIQL